MNVIIEAINLVAIRFHFEVPVYKPLVYNIANPISADVHMSPLYGQPTFIIGMIALIATVILATLLHVRTIAVAITGTMASKKQNLASDFLPWQLGKGALYALAVLMTLLLVLCLGFILIGLCTTIFSFTLTGAAGWADELTGAGVTRDFSIIEFLQAISENEPGDFSVRLLQSVFIVGVALEPIICVLLLLVLWLMPLTVKQSRVLVVIAGAFFCASFPMVFKFIPFYFIL